MHVAADVAALAALIDGQGRFYNRGEITAVLSLIAYHHPAVKKIGLSFGCAKIAYVRINYDKIDHLAELQQLLAEIGFVNIQLECNYFHYEQNLTQFLALVQERVAASQLLAIADAVYEAGLARIEADVNGRNIPSFTSEICLITLRADKR